jgi:hypothetical protein
MSDEVKPKPDPRLTADSPVVETPLPNLNARFVLPRHSPGISRLSVGALIMEGVAICCVILAWGIEKGMIPMQGWRGFLQEPDLGLFMISTVLFGGAFVLAGVGLGIPSRHRLFSAVVLMVAFIIPLAGYIFMLGR